MRYQLVLAWLTLVVILTGCAPAPYNPATYHNTSLTWSGFTSDQQAQLNSMLDDLGQLQGHSVTITSDAALPSDIAGNDTGIGTPDCAININPEMFVNGYQYQLEVVIWHEMGHCFGFLHVPDPNAIMYFQAQNFANITEAEKTLFRNQAIATGSLIYNPGIGIGASSLMRFQLPLTKALNFSIVQ